MHASKQELGRVAMPQVMRSAIQLSYIAAANVDRKLSLAGGSERLALRIIKIERPKSLPSIGLDLRRPEVLASIAVEGSSATPSQSRAAAQRTVEIARLDVYQDALSK